MKKQKPALRMEFQGLTRGHRFTVSANSSRSEARVSVYGENSEESALPSLILILSAFERPLTKDDILRSFSGLAAWAQDGGVR